MSSEITSQTSTPSTPSLPIASYASRISATLRSLRNSSCVELLSHRRLQDARRASPIPARPMPPRGRREPGPAHLPSPARRSEAAVDQAQPRRTSAGPCDETGAEALRVGLLAGPAAVERRPRARRGAARASAAASAGANRRRAMRVHGAARLRPARRPPRRAGRATPPPSAQCPDREKLNSSSCPRSAGLPCAPGVEAREPRDRHPRRRPGSPAAARGRHSASASASPARRRSRPARACPEGNSPGAERPGACRPAPRARPCWRAPRPRTPRPAPRPDRLAEPDEAAARHRGGHARNATSIAKRMPHVWTDAHSRDQQAAAGRNRGQARQSQQALRGTTRPPSASSSRPPASTTSDRPNRNRRISR